MPKQKKSRENRPSPQWLRWPFAQPPRAERVDPEEEWFETLRACFPRYEPPAEPNWGEVLQLLESHLVFRRDVWESLEVEKVMVQLKRCRPPLTGSEFAPILHAYLLERRRTGRAFTWKDLVEEAAPSNCEGYLGRLPGAAQRALEILQEQGLLEEIYGDDKRLLGYVAVEKPVPPAPSLLTSGNPQGATETPAKVNKPKRKRGRPQGLAIDPPEHARIVAAWEQRHHRTYEELARELNVDTRVVQAALDRERKRLKRRK